jgi:very-short-patch-repair endonuclease
VSKRSPYEVRLELWLSNANLPPFETEHHFARDVGRRFRLDFAWPNYRVGVEVDGGARLVRYQVNPRTGRSQPVAVGRHGQASDLSKLNLAAELGWRILRFNPEMMRRPDFVLAAIERTLRAAGAPVLAQADSTPERSGHPPAPAPGSRGWPPPR